jgi:hypothetical protein
MPCDKFLNVSIICNILSYILASAQAQHIYLIYQKDAERVRDTCDKRWRDKT